MSYKVRILSNAYQAIYDNAMWWSENRSSAQALEWYEGFIEKLQSLSEEPERFSLALENDKVPYELRELFFSLGKRPTHRALFRIQNDTVEVLVIRHVAQDEVQGDLL